MASETKKEPKPAKPAAAKPAAKPVAAQTAGKSGGKVKVTQIGSPIARHFDQRQTLIGLGLNKRHRTRMLEDTPSVRGMITKVRHLVRVETAG